jgi:hypothetical protein
MEQKTIEKNVKIKTIAIACIAMFLTYIITIAVLFYIVGVHNSVIDKTVRILRFPVAVIGFGNVVTANELGDNLVSVRKFYEGQDFSDIGFRVDFKTADGQKRLKIKEKELLNKLIENKIIQKLAADRNIVITKTMVSQSVDREIAQFDNGDNVSQKLFDLYGWDMNDFKEKLVKSDMYREELEKNMRASDIDFTKAKDKITQAQNELKTGANFIDVAKKYSEGDSALVGGDLGWFTADQMMPEISVAVFIMKAGDQSDVIESSIGFHIIQINDKRTEDGVDKVKISQIIVRKKDFADWLLEQEKDMHIFIPLKDYRWNQEAATVEFVSSEMQDFEKNLGTNSAGDISVVF